MDAIEEVRAPYPSFWQSLLIVGIALLMMIACSPLFALVAMIDTELAAMFYYLAAFGLTFYFAHTIRKRRMGTSTYNFRFAPWWLVFPLSFGSIALLLSVVAPIQSLIPMPESIQTQLGTAFEATSWSTFVYFAMAAPLLEELVFRGIILDGFLKRYTPLTSIVLSSLVFGLAHFNPWQFVTGFVIGLFLGWVYFRTRSVGACFVVHMAANSAAFLLRLLIASAAEAGEPAGPDTIGEMSPSYIAICFALWCVIAASVYTLRREFNKHGRAPAEAAIA